MLVEYRNVNISVCDKISFFFLVIIVAVEGGAIWNDEDDKMLTCMCTYTLTSKLKKYFAFKCYVYISLYITYPKSICM